MSVVGYDYSFVFCFEFGKNYMGKVFKIYVILVIYDIIKDLYKNYNFINMYSKMN